jgi:hypothetical protein
VHNGKKKALFRQDILFLFLREKGKKEKTITISKTILEAIDN